MNRTLQISAISLLLASTAGVSHAVTIPFAEKSPFAEGEWIKISISGSGVYELGYDELRSMGFKDPAKVGVCGGDAGNQPLNFFNETAGQLYTDTPGAIGVYHHGDKMYVYLRGTDHCKFIADDTYPLKGYFHKAEKNIYTNNIFYFLTDNPDFVKVVKPQEQVAAASSTATGAVAHITHEEDLFQNDSNSGQLFWGERFNYGNPSRRTWSYDLNGADIMSKGVMECVFYADYSADPSAMISFGAVNGQENASYKVKKYNYSTLYPQQPSVATVALPSSRGELFVEYSSTSNVSSFANLDYWTLSYQRLLPTLSDDFGTPIPQEEFLLNNVEPGQSTSFLTAAPAGSVVLDITDPSTPVEIQLTPMSGTIMRGTAANNGAYPRLMIFNPDNRQLRISGHCPVRDASLHELATAGADFLIITVADYMSQAQRLADLHREKDGIDVIVADAADVYNEFSAGVPDPMAYRALARMIYDKSGQRLKNILLFGPLAGDIRTADRNPETGVVGTLIAYQSTQTYAESGAFNINDWYGMMSNYINLTNSPSYPLEIGVGVLPVQSQEEADITVDKVDRYLNGDNHTYGVNDNVIVAGLYDTHMHGTHALNLYDVVYRGRSGNIVPEIIAIDAYGEQNARTHFISAFDRGASVISYIGHGAQTMLGKNTNFFALPDVKRLHNNTLPFITVAGCEISNLDRGERGIGEALVLSTRHGGIGALVATRDTWAMQNLSLMRSFYLCMYKDGNNPTPTSTNLTEPLTVGEVYARAKTLNASDNKYAYQLVSDPAIRLTPAMREMNVNTRLTDGVAGTRCTFKVTVNSTDGTTDRNFNGKGVAKLMTPVVQKVSDDFVTNTKEEENETLTVPCTEVVATAYTDITDGEGEFTIFIPYELASRAGETFNMQVGTFDNERFIGAAGKGNLRISAAAPGDAATEDTTPPVITSLRHDPATNSLVVSVSDNHGLHSGESGASSHLRVRIDGTTLTSASSVPAIISADALSSERHIPLGNLSRGTHSAMVTVTDAAGNISTAETLFTIGSADNGLTLSMRGKAAFGKAVFDTREINSPGARIVITDCEGKRIAAIAVTGEESTWNLTDTSGTRVAPGVYRAHVETYASDGTVSVSEKTDVPVV